jgi:hypothetical protein
MAAAAGTHQYFTRSKAQAMLSVPKPIPENHPLRSIPEDHPLWGIAFSVSSPDTAKRVQDAIKNREGGEGELKVATDGFNQAYINYIIESITNHIQPSGKDIPNLPIILVFDHDGSSESSDPRGFMVNDYVLVFTNNISTGINTSALPGIYRVTSINRDSTVTVEPATTSANSLQNPHQSKTRCALLRKFGNRIIIMVLEYKQVPLGSVKSGGSRRTRRPSRSKSVNKKRKYTQQRLRRSRRHRRSHRR